MEKVRASVQGANAQRQSRRGGWTWWISEVLRRARPVGPAAVSAVLDSLMRPMGGRSGGHGKLACFRSATVGTIRKRRGHRQKALSDEALDRLILYTANNLVKRPRTPLLGSPTRGGTMPTCKLRVTVLNRVAPPKQQLANAKDPFAFGRHIPRVRDLKEAILAGAAADPRLDLTLDIRLRFFEGMTLDEQVAVMQATDVLVGAHGAGLSNALFMRTNASLVELAPFAYYATVFEELALTQAPCATPASLPSPMTRSLRPAWRTTTRRVPGQRWWHCRRSWSGASRRPRMGSGTRWVATPTRCSCMWTARRIFGRASVLGARVCVWMRSNWPRWWWRWQWPNASPPLGTFMSTPSLAGHERSVSFFLSW
eukprot:TRINITY_DN2916_c0_g1_i2.p2 TRINITY_DN2916_c0_g1~~TRINITY_DN2916_c0_g1_i2.p2  ORF type:complete len:369 (+),score=50.17 TRINITY_DN2916_c0_g1_i2:1615-2721(+)